MYQANVIRESTKSILADYNIKFNTVDHASLLAKKKTINVTFMAHTKNIYILANKQSSTISN